MFKKGLFIAKEHLVDRDSRSGRLDLASTNSSNIELLVYEGSA